MVPGDVLFSPSAPGSSAGAAAHGAEEAAGRSSSGWSSDLSETGLWCEESKILHAPPGPHLPLRSGVR